MARVGGNAAKNSYAEGKWNVNYLRFLVNFMGEINVGVTEVASKLGLSRVAVYMWLRNDDMKISSIYKMFDAFDYDIEFSLEKMLQTGDAIASMTKHQTDSDRHLAFLDYALTRYQVNRAELLRNLKLAPSHLCYWMKTDDMYLSYVYKIADLCGLGLNITITPKNK